MAFDWNDYARLAEELPTRKDEASLRTAISRFYYSVYHQARDYLLDKGVPLSTMQHLILDGICLPIWNDAKREKESSEVYPSFNSPTKVLPSTYSISLILQPVLPLTSTKTIFFCCPKFSKPTFTRAFPLANVALSMANFLISKSCAS